MKKIIFVLYGSVAYVVFLATFLYTIGFVSNLMVPKSIDSGDKGELVGSIAIDVVTASALCDSAHDHGTASVQELVDSVRA